MRKFLFIFCFFAIFWQQTADAADFDFRKLENLPILHDGRVKPLDTFARVHLLAFYGKRSLPKMSAVEWLMELMLEPQMGYRRKVFKIHNFDVISMLKLERDPKNLYSFIDIFQPLQNNNKLLTDLQKKTEKERTPAQSQLLELNAKAFIYFDISRSLTLLLPILRVDSAQLAQELSIEQGKPYTYLDLLNKQNLVEEKFEKLKTQRGFEKDYVDSLIRLAELQKQISQFSNSNIFRSIPPQWQDNKDLWLSPWKLVQVGRGSPKSAKLFKDWENLAGAYLTNNTEAWGQAAASLNQNSYKAAENFVSPFLLDLEARYNRWEIFYKSIACYIFAFLVLLLSWVFWQEPLRKAALGILSFGVFLHLMGIIFRIVIMGRPPVSTLYESIIFVAFVALVFAIILEFINKNGLGVLVGSVMGSALLFVSFGYAAEGDTMEMLVAVLNTNFWLATHVVCITIGYGCCFVAAMFGHIYFVMNFFNAAKEKLKNLYQNMIGISLIALFFSLFGTILGGIWADQSWGRFWGWDPKENGAMWICLWLLCVIHGRLAGIVGPLGYSFAMVFLGIVVALAWFGVNLLNVGLHSYGFTENIATNLAMYCSIELLFGLVMYHLVKVKEASKR